MLPTIVLVATGGTISMRIDSAKGGAVPNLSGADLVTGTPGLLDIAQVEVREFPAVSSFSLSSEDMLRIARAVEEAALRPEVAGIIVTHGTDTMEETAYLIERAFAPQKPVCLTGAMRNASETSADGPANLLDAACLAAAGAGVFRGTAIVMNGEIHAAAEVTKLHKSAVQTFASLNAGPLGTVDRLGIHLRWTPQRKRALPPLPGPLPNVPILKAYTGMDSRLLDAWLALGIAELVIEGFGIGNAPLALLPGIEQAVAAGVPVVLASRVPQGATRPDYASPGGGGDLVRRGVILSGELSAQKARILLLLALASGLEVTQLPRLFAEETR
jgi:L-asparaginase